MILQIAYNSDYVINLLPTHSGTYYLFGLHYADGSKEDGPVIVSGLWIRVLASVYPSLLIRMDLLHCSIQTVTFLLFRLLQKSLRQMVFLSHSCSIFSETEQISKSVLYTTAKIIKSFSVLMLLDLLLSLPSLIRRQIKQYGIHTSWQSSLGSQMVYGYKLVTPTWSGNGGAQETCLKWCRRQGKAQVRNNGLFWFFLLTKAGIYYACFFQANLHV